jgi:hypothetical protein
LPAALPLALAAGSPARADAADECAGKGTRVLVDSASHRMWLCEGGKTALSVGVRLAREGVGKSKEGDGKVPLGTYPLGAARKSEKFGTFIPIGYPTGVQRKKGFTGGGVGVHGPHRMVRWLGRLTNTFDSTDGCVGVATDAEMSKVAVWTRRARARTIEIR